MMVQFFSARYNINQHAVERTINDRVQSSAFTAFKPAIISYISYRIINSFIIIASHRIVQGQNDVKVGNSIYFLFRV